MTKKPEVLICPDNAAVRELVATTKLWEVLEIALRDLKKVEADPKFMVDMDQWYINNPEDVCHVCLAGSVMANMIDLPHRIYPTWFADKRIVDRLLTLDQLRRGNVARARAEMKLDLTVLVYNPIWLVPPYGSNYWWESMERMLAYLKEEDL